MACNWSNGCNAWSRAWLPTPYDWSLTDSCKCHLGRWLSRAAQLRDVYQGHLASLQQSHAEMHHLAAIMGQHYRDGRFDEARQGLPRLRSVHRMVTAILAQLFLEQPQQS